MGNLQAYINYHCPLTFVQNLNEQVQDCGSITHPGLGLISLWKIKEANQPQMFSFYAHVYEKDSSLIEIHKFRCTLRHPNLLQYYACATTKGQNIGRVQSQQFFFEYYPKTLKNLIHSKSLSETEIWKIIEQLVDVMTYLQVHQRFHGDLRSETILLTDTNQIKVIDQFGQKPNPLAVKADVFDLGLVIIEMITKKTTQLNFISEIKTFAGTYSLQLLQLTAKMIQKESYLRPDFFEIKQLISKRFQEPILYNMPITQRKQNINIIKIIEKQQTNNRPLRQIQNSPMKSTSPIKVVACNVSKSPPLQFQRVSSASILPISRLLTEKKQIQQPANVGFNYTTPRKPNENLALMQYSTTAIRTSPNQLSRFQVNPFGCSN